MNYIYGFSKPITLSTYNMVLYKTTRVKKKSLILFVFVLPKNIIHHRQLKSLYSKIYNVSLVLG